MYFLLKVVVFHCYVSLPEGTFKKTPLKSGICLETECWLLLQTSFAVVEYCPESFRASFSTSMIPMKTRCVENSVVQKIRVFTSYPKHADFFFNATKPFCPLKVEQRLSQPEEMGLKKKHQQIWFTQTNEKHQPTKTHQARFRSKFFRSCCCCINAQGATT